MSTEDPPVSANKTSSLLRKELCARLESLAAAVDAVHADAGFRQLLSGMARLWRYSVYNQVWIAGQRRDATSVAGKKQWAERGRTVREGEQPICILAPSRPGRGGWPFLLVEVFDIAQTDGPAPPPLADFNPARGECPDCSRIEAAADKLGITVEVFDPRLHPDMYGNIESFAGRALGGKVQVIPWLSPLAKAATLAHEYTHELLHEPGKNPHPPPRSVRETEAEATAFVVMESLGYSIGAPTYVAWQGGRGSVILRSMRRIAVAAKAILTAVEGKRPRAHIPLLDEGEQASRHHDRRRVRVKRVARL